VPSSERIQRGQTFPGLRLQHMHVPKHRAVIDVEVEIHRGGPVPYLQEDGHALPDRKEVARTQRNLRACQYSSRPEIRNERAGEVSGRDEPHIRSLKETREKTSLQEGVHKKRDPVACSLRYHSSLTRFSRGGSKLTLSILQSIRQRLYYFVLQGHK
jgi:hypothetical protein